MISSDGLKHLKTLTNLEHLNIAGNNIDDDAIPHLKAIKGLKYVQVSFTKISKEAIEKLTEVDQSAERFVGK